jgi:hypothetical protein
LIVVLTAVLDTTCVPPPPPVMITEPLPDMVPETTPPPEKVIVPLSVTAPDKVPPLTTSAPPASTIGPTTVPPAATSTTPELRTTMPLLVSPKVTPQKPPEPISRVAPVLNTGAFPGSSALPNSSKVAPLSTVRLLPVPPEAIARVMPLLTTKPLRM